MCKLRLGKDLNKTPPNNYKNMKRYIDYFFILSKLGNFAEKGHGQIRQTVDTIREKICKV